MKESKKGQKIKIYRLLEKNDLVTKELCMISKHLHIMDEDSDYVIARLQKEGIIKVDEGLTEMDKALLLHNLIMKCDAGSDDYDLQVDAELVRIGLKTNIKTGHCHNIWANGMFLDDGFGLGAETTSIYDDQVDHMNDVKLKIKKNSND